MTHQDTDRDTARTRPGDRQDVPPAPPGDLFTVAEVAARLGVTPDAVRRRLHRGTLVGMKTAAGEWRVLLPDTTPPGPRHDRVTGDRPDPARTRQDVDRVPVVDLLAGKDALIAQLTGETTYLRDQLDQRSRELADERQRADVLHREAIARFPMLTAGEGAPTTVPAAPDGPERGDVGVRSSATTVGLWWRRLLGRR